MLPQMLAGYLFLLIFRPYEYWPILGDFRIERVYMLIFMAMVFFSRDKQYTPSPINGAVVLFSLLLLVSSAFSFSWDASWGLTQDYLKYVIFYLMAILSIRNEKDFRFIVVAFIGVMFLYVGKSAWEFFLHDRYVWRMGIRRMVGIDATYGDPNSFAASICYSLPLAWAMIRSKFDNVWMRRFFWAYGFLALVAIMFTGSRSGMVTFLLFLFLLVMGTSRKMLGIVLAGLLLIFSWDYMPEDLQMRFLSTFSSEYSTTEGGASSAEGRAAGFRQGLKLFADNPVLGVGPANFPLNWPGLVRGPNAHNLYGQLLGELGFLGFCIFGTMIWLVYRNNANVMSRWKLWQKTHNQENGVISASGKSMRTEDKTSETKNGVGGQKRNGILDGLLSISSPLALHPYVAQAIIQTMLLMFFKGWADHNLYRYTWLWLAALTVLNQHYFNLQWARHGQR
jgi:O-antigen ligase